SCLYLSNFLSLSVFQLQTFQVPSCVSKHELTSGVAIAHVLNKIDSSWFNETWLSRIKEDGGTNWRLKVSNLKKILQSMMEYYHDVLGQQVSDEHVPDVCLIGEMGDVTELGRLLQLVLGCAVSCDQKQEHIQQIMTLEESVQHVVMTAIQELLTKGPVEAGTPETYGDFDSQSRKYYFLSEETDDRDYTHRCRELQQQVSVLMEEKSSLQVELQSLRERLNRCETPDVSSTITNKKLLLLQSQMEQLQEENYRLDSSRDDLRVRADVLEREVTDLQLRNEELTSLAQEAQSLKDEMDILRSETRLEAMVETYKRKLEDLGDLRRQVRLLEERNHVYMQRTCELEEELRRANAIRSQLDTYKRQAHEMSAKHSAEAMKAEKWQFEYKNLNDKYETLLKEREKLIGERDALRETTEELRCAQVQQQCLTDSLSAESGAVGSLAAEIMPTELRDTVVRLQQENKTLCVQEESYRHRQEELQTQLEDSQRSQNTLETQNRLSQQQISELSALVEELQRALQDSLKIHLNELIHSNDSESGDDTLCVCVCVCLCVCVSVAKKIDELQEILKKKDEDMRRMEDRYKRYVEKARTVIKTLDPKQKSSAVPAEVQVLKNQLTEKDRKIQHLEHDFERTRSRHDQEEKLIISAWYNMVRKPQEHVAGERSGPGSAPAQSFLAQQRQWTQARRGLSRLQPR
uniref:Calponin-homology (CH) domain-containing protein n=1 Tax=Sinocyclocheilus rhinocerous TaxID=307959 RepID=A0A673IUF9_9TELE